MASLIAKRKGKKTYYYLAESRRVDGKPRIVHQQYLGTAEKIAELVKKGSAPVPIEASTSAFGLVAALWLAAERSGVLATLNQIWPAPRSGPSTAHYLLLAAIHRVCAPGPKTEVAEWYERSVLASLLGFDSSRFSSQAFWDCFDRIQLEPIDSSPGKHDQIEIAQSALLALWKQAGRLGNRLLSYDTTNFHTYFASTNDRSTLAQRGRNKQGRHNLRQIGLAHVLDGTTGISVCHHVYAGNVADVIEFSAALPHLLHHLDANQIPRDDVTLVFDKGPECLPNLLALDQAGLGFVSALPWSEVPEPLRQLSLKQLPALRAEHPGVQALGQVHEIQGIKRLCVVSYSSAFMSEQLHSLTASLAKATQALRRLSHDLAKASNRLSIEQVRTKVERLLSGPYLKASVPYEIKAEGKSIELQFRVDASELQRVIEERLGRTVLVTNRLEWSAEEVVTAYGKQQALEQMFRGFKGGEWLGWGPIYHWTDHKIRIHAFCCLLGMTLLQSIRMQAREAVPGISIEELKRELEGIERVQLLYSEEGERGRPRLVEIETKQTLTQQILSKALNLPTLPKTSTKRT